MISSIELVLIGIAALATALSASSAAISAYLLAKQNAQVIKARKATVGQQLFESFITSPELSAFREAVRAARYNEALARHMAQTLQATDEYDLDDYRRGAEFYAAFLRHVFYNVEDGLIEPERVNHIIGVWIVDFYTFKEILCTQHNFPESYVPFYFPEIPHKLMKVIAPTTLQVSVFHTTGHPKELSIASHWEQQRNGSTTFQPYNPDKTSYSAH